MGALTPVSQSTGLLLDDVACYAKGALVSGAVSLLTSACLMSNNTLPEIAAIATAICMAHLGGQHALAEKSKGLEGRAPVLAIALSAAVAQSFVEVADAAGANRFPGWIAGSIAYSFVAAPFCALASSIIIAMAVAPVCSNQTQALLDMVEFEKGISKAVETVEGAKSYPVRKLVSSTDDPILERCVVAPQDNESLQRELLAQGFERLENSANGMFFKKSTSMDFQVALFENESDLMGYMEPAPVEIVSPAVEEIQPDIIIQTEEELSE